MNRVGSDRVTRARKRARETEQQSVERKASDRQSKSRERACETDFECVERKQKRRHVMASAKAVDKGVSVTIEKFLAKIKQGPDFTCTGYHRMMYKHTVGVFKPGKYLKSSPELMQKITKNLHVSADGRESGYAIPVTVHSAEVCYQCKLRLMEWS